MYSEYAVEVYDKETEAFLYQVDIFESKKAAKQFIKKNPQRDGKYGILKITYDEFGIEQSTERV